LEENWSSWVPVWNKTIAGTFANIIEGEEESIGTASLTEISEETHGAYECISISGFRVDPVDQGVKQYVESVGRENDHEGLGRIQALLRQLESLFSPQYLACTFGNGEKDDRSTLAV
jgi:hypothetical protein